MDTALKQLKKFIGFFRECVYSLLGKPEGDFVFRLLKETALLLIIMLIVAGFELVGTVIAGESDLIGLFAHWSHESLACAAIIAVSSRSALALWRWFRGIDKPPRNTASGRKRAKERQSKGSLQPNKKRAHGRVRRGVNTRPKK